MSLRLSSDAFGQALLDHLRGGPISFVIERDDGYVDVGSTREYFTPAREWPANHSQALRYVRGRVLDVGCGAGRHALHLQEKGFAVLGIDSSPLAARVCRARGVKQVRALGVEHLPCFRRPFDTILMLGNNLGLLGGRVRGRRLLARFADITTPDARLIAESLDPRASRKAVHAQYHQRNRRAGRMPGQVRIRIRYQRYVGRWFDYLFVSREELEELVDGTAWRVARTLDSGGPGHVAVLEKNR